MMSFEMNYRKSDQHFTFLLPLMLDFSLIDEDASRIVRFRDKSFHYIGLLKAVMRLSMTSLKAADANEKLKVEKEANAGKKKAGAKKKQPQLDKPDNDAVIAAYDDADDYDFM
ncbi:hypothetical protein RND81_11G201200 [Saponaria officinalis]|uniref:Eukaryotic translation initiation factor 3 30 kDa subunit n=1 Tax=Saponaria officinalis TaxID=3572 RepID=A0AAW1HQ18_SAPOF